MDFISLLLPYYYLISNSVVHDTVTYFKSYMYNILFNCIILPSLVCDLFLHLNILLSSVMRFTLAFKLLIDLSLSYSHIYIRKPTLLKLNVLSFKCEIE